MPEMTVVLMITLRSGIWRITKDGAFYGDYRSKGLATEGAETAAVALKSAGRAVKIVVLPNPEDR